MAKSVLITGCSENTIGNHLALEFAKRKWTVYASARNPDKMSNLKDHPNIILLALDVMDSKTVFVARDQISREQGGKLDLLYHNAGVRSMSMVIDYDESEKKSEDESYIRPDDVWMFEGNVIAVMAMTRAFSKLLIASKGTIAITGSGAGRVAMPGSGTYDMTKAAIEMYARHLRMEMNPFGVKVVYVMTGMVATAMNLQRMEIAEDSPYKPIADKITDGWEPKGTPPQPAHEYAQYVVERVARANPPNEVWSGTTIGMLWWVEKLGLSWLLDPMYLRQHGLHQKIA